MIFFAPGHVVLPDAFFKYIYKTAPEKHNLISADMWLDEGMRGQGFAASKVWQITLPLHSSGGWRADQISRVKFSLSGVRACFNRFVCCLGCYLDLLLLNWKTWQASKTLIFLA